MCNFPYKVLVTTYLKFISWDCLCETHNVAWILHHFSSSFQLMFLGKQQKKNGPVAWHWNHLACLEDAPGFCLWIQCFTCNEAEPAFYTAAWSVPWLICYASLSKQKWQSWLFSMHLDLKGLCLLKLIRSLIYYCSFSRTIDLHKHILSICVKILVYPSIYTSMKSSPQLK